MMLFCCVFVHILLICQVLPRSLSVGSPYFSNRDCNVGGTVGGANIKKALIYKDFLIASIT